MTARQMVLRAMAAIAAMAPGLCHGYTIVMKDGAEIEARDAPDFRDGRALFTVVSGSRAFAPAERIDSEATQAKNEGRSLGYKYRDITSWWKRDPYEPPWHYEPPAVDLGLVAPGGIGKSCYDKDDLSAARGRAVSKAPAEGRTELSVRHAKLEEELRAIFAELERIGRQLPDATALAPLRATGAASIGAPSTELPLLPGSESGR